MASSSRLSNNQKLLYDVKLNSLKINDNRIDFLKDSELLQNNKVGYTPSFSVGNSCLQSQIESKSTQLGNVAYGINCLPKNTSGQYNVASGLNCLSENISGSYNTTFGFSTMNGYTNLYQCVAIGNYSLTNFSNINKNEVTDNIAIGYSTSYNSSNGSFNTVIGNFSNNYNTGSNNIMLGYEALYSTTPFNTNDSTYIGSYIKPINKIKNEIILNTTNSIKESIRGSNTMILGNDKSNNIHMPGLITNNDPKFSELKKGSLYYEEDTGIVKVKLN